jgi:uncharacterized protein (DUF58 family)
VFAVGFAALNTGNNLLYLVLALLLGFLVLSGVLSESSLRGVRVERILPRELFAGSPGRIVLRIYNGQPRVASFALSVEDRWSDGENLLAAGRGFALRIPRASSVERSYLFEPPRRGDLELVGMRVSTRFPFGLFVKSIELTCPSQALVYPHVSPLMTQPASSSGLGESDASGSGHDASGSVIGLREYVRGDSARRVHWRRSLRAREWLVAERASEETAEVEVCLTLPPHASQPVIEERIERAASEVVAHLDAGLRVGLRTPRSRYPADMGRAQRATLLGHLARLELPTAATSSPEPGALSP